MRKSKFNLTHLNSHTLDPGYLVPFLLMPTLPNDSFRISLATFIRAQPMLAPLMHEVRLFTQYWYVPYRLVWDRWEEFITGGDNLDSTPAFPVVVSTADDAKVGTLWDYFGFPLETGIEVSALPFRSLALIYNTRYRDEDLQEEIPVSFGDGTDRITSRNLLSPSISKDYFSIARPFTQRGADIFVPITQGESSTNVIHRHTFSYNNILPAPYVAPPSEYHSYLKKTYIGATFSALVTAGSVGALALPSILKGPTIVTEENWEEFYTALSSYWQQRAGNNGSMVVSYSDPSELSRVYQESIEKFKLGISTFISSVLPGTLTLRFNLKPGGATVCTYSITNFRISFYGISLNNDATVTALGANEIPTNVAPNVRTNSSVVRMQSSSTLNNNNSAVVYQVLSGVGQVSIRDIRASSSLQRYAERSLKFGNRYEEFIQREFGIKPRDSRIQRPEYLGGGSGILNISEVLQTAESTDTGVGTMRGHGIASISQRNIRFRSPEHGLIIGLLSIRPQNVYTQGIDREFLKRSRLDFFTPELANIGMQEVLTQELYATSSNKGEIFGYSDRYQEYRYKKPLVCGEFRGNLDFWNMAFKFASQPELNSEFLSMATYASDYKRPFQIQDGGAHAFICMLKNIIKAYRPIPKIAKDILR